ncbi:antibiotic biosynthesis monooxygenase [Edaphobacter albus]|uniref:antibiotic biosynthesis monooxygenase n=1 Tax=Edaphobacter sp. 4G125 TaxID=2763071 RepID=UPI001646AD8A|nr:antibiotic biosynthesis monooxygenase [Edaphobacter sp. 4G125]QNI37859.1 antibiotic biosynthesis monooxygenase [Edaphobacter sp. 4G125]
MIARHWRGWTEPDNADAYEHLLKTTVLPDLRKIKGYRGGYVLRKDTPSEVEFVVINLFDSLDSVKRFAGPEYEVAVFEPEARHLLSRVELLAHHYQVAASSPLESSVTLSKSSLQK